VLTSNEKCKICNSYLKRNGRDGRTLFYWCEECDSHYHTMDDELILAEGPNNEKYKEGEYE